MVSRYLFFIICSILIISSVEYNKSFIFKILIVYAICGKYKFSIHLSQYPIYELRCNLSTNYKDFYEGGLILDFLIKIYNHPMADKYIFCQGHDRSYHYRINFWDRINYISSTKYFKNNNFGGIYCLYIHCYNHYIQECVYDVENYFKKLKISKYSLTNLNITEPCCSTFFLSHSLIIKRKLSLYISLRKALTDYVEKHIFLKNNICKFKHSTNKRAALFIEHYWGALFGKPNSIVPSPPDCLNNG